MKYNEVEENHLRTIIHDGFWKLDKNQKRALIKALEHQLAVSPSETSHIDVVLDENNKPTFISVPKKYTLVIEDNGEDRIYEINNYGVDTSRSKAYQIQEVTFKDKDARYVVSPKGIIECEKILTRHFDLVSRETIIKKVRAEEGLRRLVDEYMPIVNSSGHQKEKSMFFNEILRELSIIDKTSNERGITIRQIVSLEDGKLSLENRIYDPYGIITVLPGYEYDIGNKYFFKSEDLEKSSVLDFNIVLDELNDNLGTSFSDDTEYPHTPIEFLSVEKEKLDKLLKLYEAETGISHCDNTSGIINTFVISGPKSYKNKKNNKKRN